MNLAETEKKALLSRMLELNALGKYLSEESIKIYKMIKKAEKRSKDGNKTSRRYQSKKAPF